MTTFQDLGLTESLLRALKQEGYENPTPIQAQAIPPLLEGHDLLGIAQTGTGKTAAFALPILNKLLADPKRPAPRHIRALILAPTRELAVQITDSFRTYGRHAKLSVATIVGGMSPGPQIQALSRGLDIAVATPGRLLDHVMSGNAKLDKANILVLDEADHMLDLGFIVPIRKLLKYLPKERQSLFFSATMPKEIAGLADEILHKPVRISVTPIATTAERVNQEAYLVESGGKRHLLVELLESADMSRVIVFTRTKRGADKVTEHLESAEIRSAAIHGNKSQGQRQRALDQFKRGNIRVLVATDIAARGIDVDNISHVINYELPDVPESYVHRIGRTARAGTEGTAISFCDNSERGLLRSVERLTRQTIPVTDRRMSPGRTRSEDSDRPVREREVRPMGSRAPSEGRSPEQHGYEHRKRTSGPQRHGRNGPSGGSPRRDSFRDEAVPRREGGFRTDYAPRDGARESGAREGGFRDGPKRTGGFREGGFKEGGFREARRDGPARNDGFRGGGAGPRSNDARSNDDRPRAQNRPFRNSRPQKSRVQTD